MSSTVRRVLVTGANRGFGATIVKVFDRAGWDVVGVSREVVGRERGRWVHWDVTDDDVSPLTGSLGDEPLDLLINNAGTGTPGTPLDGVVVSTLLDVCDVNVGGVIRATRAVLPNLRRTKQPIVINVSSRLGSIHDQAAGRYRGFGTSYAYRIAKAAQNMATTCLAEELAPDVRVWAVHPGRLATGMGRADAATDPAVAAQRLLDLVRGPEKRSPLFLDLENGELPW
ncbi:NAD(P)-dependent dehydrogenase (short-subunit alcohol dehydrogenase family) [Nocardioides luteus]|uniref:Short-chain dehydrogenase n=1 Tax=Nocardioides luteus TaxID=1844 RepID=A0ABQ5SS33_9ACTN|nr:SDR family NAD(P)-dependent oxidoreductase [Nocardioides luteus]MDR7313207.1 NAD(P)-dependent dehydrogenase (short-subunit alcohol dehydrogenase family) [Nocardioides luteus]GGR43308.1 short-chain dehydrogenase [Nocardioides luteus]GLJ66272.1 short-chain dehydrogenase [Nocardioides luteus]